MGVVSPVGCSVNEFWESLCEGRSGIRPITRFDTSGFAVSRAGEIPDFEMPHDLGLEPATTDLATQFMVAAAKQSIEDSGLLTHEDYSRNTGIVLSTNFGGASAAEELIESVVNNSPVDGTALARYSFQSAADCVANCWRLAGPRSVLSLSCSSGTAALGYGVSLIRSGRARAIVTGGYDSLSRFCWSGLSALRTMTTDELRPFDKRRKGTLFSEGAGAIVIEDYEFAMERGAHIYAEVMGYGLNNNAHHMTAPAKEGAGSAAVMSMALADARIEPREVDHINTHGTGTKYNDITETQAIKTVFGEHAPSIPITSIKSTTGHMMGAAGSVEAIASILTMTHGVIPPTINYGEPDPECDLDCVTNKSRTVAVSTVLSNSAGIGGCNAAVLLGLPQDMR